MDTKSKLDTGSLDRLHKILVNRMKIIETSFNTAIEKLSASTEYSSLFKILQELESTYKSLERNFEEMALRKDEKSGHARDWEWIQKCEKEVNEMYTKMNDVRVKMDSFKSYGDKKG